MSRVRFLAVSAIVWAALTMSGWAQNSPDTQESAPLFDRPLNLDLDYRTFLDVDEPQKRQEPIWRSTSEGSGAKTSPRAPTTSKKNQGGWVRDPVFLHRNQNKEAGHYQEMNQKLLGIDFRKRF